MELGPIIISEDEARRDLTLFHLTGRRPFWATAPEEDQLPALLHALRSVSHVRFDYPVIVSEERVQTLTGLIDDLLESTTAEGDELEKLTRDLHRLEVLIRSSYENGDSLLQSWDDGLELLIRGTVPAKRTETAARMAHLRPACEGVLLDCDPQTVGRMFALMGTSSKKSIREKAIRLQAALQDVLAAGAPAAFHEEHSDVDSDALAGLIERVANPLPPKRRLRIQMAEKMLSLVDAEAPAASLTTGGRTALADLEKYLASYRTHVTKAVRALRVAELEASNRYKDSRHDPLFEHFGWADVLPSDLADFPPPLVILDTRECEEGIQPALLRLLSGDVPVKLLLLYDTVFDADLRPSTWSRLALSAAMTSPAFVWNGPASALPSLRDGIERAIAFEGPALLSLFVPPSITLPAYLIAAAAQDARIVPSFISDPSAGEALSARFSITGNAQIERIWPVEEGEQTFSAADFAACDLRLRRRFALADHPFECLTDGSIPTITMVDADGRAHYAVLSRQVAAFVADVADYWRRVRELGGIENSHVLQVLETERARFDAELKRAVDEAEARVAAEYERTASGIAEEIVSNIAAGLLHLPRHGNGEAPATRVEGLGTKIEDGRSRIEGRGRPASPEIQAGSEVAAVVEEEEEVLVLDDAYIDTPLCTTCNECTNLNSMIFAYNADKQAYVKDPSGGPYRDLVTAAELCPVHVIHPGRPKNPSEPGLDELLKRAQPYL